MLYQASLARSWLCIISYAIIAVVLLVFFRQAHGWLGIWGDENVVQLVARNYSRQNAFTLRQSFVDTSGSTSPSLQILHHVQTDMLSPKAANPMRQQFIVQSILHGTNRYNDGQQRALGPEPENHMGVNKPNVTDKQTVVNLAKMTSDTYIELPGSAGWFNLSEGFNASLSFGWKKDGLRGHVFANADNSTVIIAFKGTTINPRERIRNADRENDNVLFSCCCAEQRKDPWWYGSVCDCRNATYSCNSTCLTQNCGREDRYYAKAMEVVFNVTSQYPRSQVWFVGHSLGGTIASLMGMTFNAPAVTFESPPERLPAQRLGLALPPLASYQETTHFGHNSDPVFTGECYGYSSSCSLAGYAFESSCFTGKICTYNSSGDLGWHLNIWNHRINTVIDGILERYDEVANCTYEDPTCTDCPDWNYF